MLRPAFPARLPSSLSDCTAIVTNDWDAFCGVDVMRDHWTVKHWPTGRRGYYWYLTFDDSGMRELAGECQRRLGVDGTDPVPLDGLHITVLGIGGVDQFTETEIASKVAAAQEELRGFDAFDVTVGPLTGSGSAIRLSVAPWDRLLDLHAALAGVGAEPTRFRPHLGIAYNNIERPAGPVIDAVRALRGIEPVAVRVKQIELVVVRREAREYRWDTMAAVALS